MISIKERKEKIEYLKARIFEINQLNEEIKGNDLVLKNNYSTLTLENKNGNYFIKSYIEK